VLTLIALTDEERATLRELAADGPKRLRPPVLGRLALYNLVSETPQGWRITEAGKDALDRAPSGTTHTLPPAEPERPRPARLRNQRRSPFD